jgi:hypothetical protein
MNNHVLSKKNLNLKIYFFKIIFQCPLLDKRLNIPISHILEIYTPTTCIENQYFNRQKYLWHSPPLAYPQRFISNLKSSQKSFRLIKIAFWFFIALWKRNFTIVASERVKIYKKVFSNFGAIFHARTFLSESSSEKYLWASIYLEWIFSVI